MSVLNCTALAVLCCGLVAAQPISGQWTIGPLPVSDKVELTLHRSAPGSNMSTSSALPLSQLRGLTRSQMDSGGSTVRFDIARDAGVLHCEGYFKGGSGGGAFTFEPGAAFVSHMQRLGYSSLSGETVFQMAVHDVTSAWVEDLR